MIDDDPAMKDLLRRLLAREGVEVLGASQGDEGLALIRSAAPLAVILDLKLPGMSGWQVLREIRSDPSLADLPVAVLSIIDDERHGRELGANRYFVKPIEPAPLIAFVREAARGRLAPAEPVRRAG